MSHTLRADESGGTTRTSIAEQATPVEVATPWSARRRARASLWFVALATLASALIGVAARSTYGAQVSVDEPQYLMTALSLARDFDLDISDEIENQEFRSFHAPSLNTQTTPVDEAGRRFSPHDPLLPLLLAPAMGIGGWVGARLSLAAFMVIAAVVTQWTALARLRVDPWTAAPIVTLLYSANPMAPYATQIYPEISAAACVAMAVAVLTSPRQLGHRGVLGTLCVIVALPWLAVKYASVGGVIALWLVWRLRNERATSSAAAPTGERRWTPSAAIVVLAISGAIYALVHQRIYGGWTVYASGDHFIDTGEFAVVGTRPNLPGRARRLALLLVERRFGIVPWQPLWLLTPLTAVWLWRRGFRFALGVALAGYFTATFVALTMQGWWSPGRQIVVILPIVVLGAVGVVDELQGRFGRLLTASFIVVGVLGVVNWWWLAVESTTDRRTILVDFFDTASPPYQVLYRLFPDPLANDDEWLFFVWVPVLIGLLEVGRRLFAPRPPDTAALRAESDGEP